MGFRGLRVLRDGFTFPAVLDPHADYTAQMRQRLLRATLTDSTGAHTELELDVFGVIEFPTHDICRRLIAKAPAQPVIDGRGWGRAI